jgi:integrase
MAHRQRLPKGRPSRLPYLLKRPDADGWYFNRKVPRDLVAAIGKTHWRWKLGDNLATARKALPEAVAQTDALIEELRGDSQTSAKLLPSHRPIPIPRDLDARLLHGRPDLLHELAALGVALPDDPELIASLPPEPVPLRYVTSQDLIDTAVLLKTTASPQTKLAWSSVLEKLVAFLGHDQLHLVTREDTAKFRDSMLQSLKVSTVKTRLNYLSGLFAVGVEEQLLPANPFAGVGKRLRTEDKQDKSYDMVTVDQAARTLPSDQYVVYQLLRYTGCRLAEVLGLKTSDIDLNAGVLNIIPHPDRPLKTRESKRVIPIHPQIRELLQSLLRGPERPFIQYYNEVTSRWGGGIAWSKPIGINPHGLRHNAVTSMRLHNIQEKVIARVVGHTIPGMTAQYGSVPLEKLQEAVRAII